MKKILFLFCLAILVTASCEKLTYNKLLDKYDECIADGYQQMILNYNKELDEASDFPFNGEVKDKVKQIAHEENSELIDIEYCDIYTYWVKVDDDSGYWQTTVYYRYAFPQYQGED